jgi:hypothetical protein
MVGWNGHEASIRVQRHIYATSRASCRRSMKEKAFFNEDKSQVSPTRN